MEFIYFVGGQRLSPETSPTVYLTESLDQMFPTATFTFQDPSIYQSVRLGSLIRVLIREGGSTYIDHTFYVSELEILSSGTIDSPGYLDRLTAKTVSQIDILQPIESRGIYGSVSDVATEIANRVRRHLSDTKISPTTDSPRVRYLLQSRPLQLLRRILKYGLIGTSPVFSWITLKRVLHLTSLQEIRSQRSDWTIVPMDVANPPTQSIAALSFGRFAYDNPKARSFLVNQVNLISAEQRPNHPKSLRLPNRPLTVDPVPVYGETLLSPIESVAEFINTQSRYDQEASYLSVVIYSRYDLQLRAGSALQVKSPGISGNFYIKELTHIKEPAAALTKLTLVRL